MGKTSRIQEGMKEKRLGYEKRGEGEEQLTNARGAKYRKRYEKGLRNNIEW